MCCYETSNRRVVIFFSFFYSIDPFHATDLSPEAAVQKCS